jgi:peroxiredoxin
MMLKPGDKAPVFTLFDTEKNKVNLSDYGGQNVLILFFPLAFTSVCTTELCSVRDNLSQYAGLNTAVLGISVDSLFTLKKYKDDQALNFPLLSDFNKSVSSDYGSLYEKFGFDMKGVSKRSAFVVDGGGVIRYAEVLENAGEIPDFKAIQQCLLTFG